MATTINTGSSQVTVLNAAERVTGTRGYWEVTGHGGQIIVVNRKRAALRLAAGIARRERAQARRARAAHAVFVTLSRAEQAALLVAMNTGRQSDRDRAARLYEDLAHLTRVA